METSLGVECLGKTLQSQSSEDLEYSRIEHRLWGRRHSKWRGICIQLEILEGVSLLKLMLACNGLLSQVGPHHKDLEVEIGQLKFSCIKPLLLLSWEIRQICLLKLQLGNLTYLGHCLEHWSFKQVLHSKGRIS